MAKLERLKNLNNDKFEALIALEASGGKHRGATFRIDMACDDRDPSDCEVRKCSGSRIHLQNCFASEIVGYMTRQTSWYGLDSSSLFFSQSAALALGMSNDTHRDETFRFRLYYPWSLLDIWPHRGDRIAQGHVTFYSRLPVQVIKSNCHNGTHGLEEQEGSDNGAFMYHWYRFPLDKNRSTVDITLTIRPTLVPQVPTFDDWSQDPKLVLETVLEASHWSPTRQGQTTTTAARTGNCRSQTQGTTRGIKGVEVHSRVFRLQCYVFRTTV